MYIQYFMCDPYCGVYSCMCDFRAFACRDKPLPAGLIVRPARNELLCKPALRSVDLR